ncbi:MAG: hypothetical protein CMH22_05025 [Methylophaga sp.]|nr:hypothetical protein [Methylophaga sp.]MAX51319.1 hypothetical protein [Methylophaga sp.]|tara:strand:- start:36271 stop:36504 length:234 start_codon:yes stop_codon:yes gene_type:complete
MKIIVALTMVLILTACGGYDAGACYNSAKEFMDSKNGEVHLIPGKNWRYIGTTEDSVFYMEALAHSHCGLTQTYKVK